MTRRAQFDPGDFIRTAPDTHRGVAKAHPRGTPLISRASAPRQRSGGHTLRRKEQMKTYRRWTIQEKGPQRSLACRHGRMRKVQYDRPGKGVHLRQTIAHGASEKKRDRFAW